MAGENGMIALTYKTKNGKIRYKTKTVGFEDGDLKPGIWYRLDENDEFVEI
jgi:hypothetical protein